jgi:hypothetical protein
VFHLDKTSLIKNRPPVAAQTNISGGGKAKPPPRLYRVLWFAIRKNAAPPTGTDKLREEKKIPFEEGIKA